MLAHAGSDENEKGVGKNWTGSIMREGEGMLENLKPQPKCEKNYFSWAKWM